MILGTFLKLLGLRVVDKRPMGGCLWVVSNKQDFELIKNVLARKEIYFNYCENSKTIYKQYGQYQPAWWTKFSADPATQQEIFSSILMNSFRAAPIAQLPQNVETIVVEPIIEQEIPTTCFTCAHNFECHEAFHLYEVGCDRYLLSLAYRN